MPKILIADDDVKRASLIKDKLTSDCNIPVDMIFITQNVNDAKKLLRLNQFDLLLIDVVLPLRNGEVPDHSNGLNLLNFSIKKSEDTFKPLFIIGITSVEDKLDYFRQEFLKKCILVIPAHFNSSEWVNNITEFVNLHVNLNYQFRPVNEKLCIITIHGIRTFGQWQTTIQKQIKAVDDRVIFLHYKYGYFDVLRFLFKAYRDKEAIRFANKLVENLKQLSDRQCTIIAHSYGTYIAVKSIDKVLEMGHDIHFENLILCGSIFDPWFKFSTRITNCVSRIINECGIYDFPLCLTSVFIRGTGASGRVGFYGFSGTNFINRFFSGGHSLFFEEQFIKSNWIPLITNNNIEYLDERKPSQLSRYFDNIIIYLSKFQTFNFYFVILLFIFSIIYLIYRD